MKNQGYYRFPDVRKNNVVFVSEDDLWQVPLKGGTARRLTANRGAIYCPKISPNGKWITYSAEEEGYREIYIMDANGSQHRRLSYLATIFSNTLGWSADSKYIYFASNFQQAFDTSIYKIAASGGEPVPVGVGHAWQISHGKKGCVIGRHTRDTARWKRYKGGRAGCLWIDSQGKGQFRPLLDLNGNIADPIWLGNRIYFIADHEGIGNLYSCNTSGDDIQRHTHHQEFYARNASGDDKTIVYHAGADLYAFDSKSNKSRKLKIHYHSSRTQTNRKFVSAANYLQGYDLNSQGTHTAMVTRGKLFSFAHWSGPVSQWGEKQGIRYRLPSWLQDGIQLMAVGEGKQGEDRLVQINTEDGKEVSFSKVNIGRIHGIFPSPKENKAIVSNNRNQIFLIEGYRKSAKLLDSSDYARIRRVSWSPDGKWIAYDFAETPETTVIKILKLETETSYKVTEPLREDFSPVFSSNGKYLFFLGRRVFYPVYDSLQFELSFLKSTKLYAVSLTKESPSPFIMPALAPDNADRQESWSAGQGKDKSETKIETNGIERRIAEFPIQAGMYSSLSTYNNMVFFLEYPRDGVDHGERRWFDTPKPRHILKMYDLAKQSQETITRDISGYILSLKGNNAIIRRTGQLSIHKSGDKPKEKAKEKYGLESGKINMARIKVCIDPIGEWQQMYREAWLLQREHFWNENMSGVDWPLVYKRYYSLIDRTGTRGEFSDLMWEMQGELGTSHCYEMGGDYRRHPVYPIGKLGCHYSLAKNGQYYIFDKILYGDASIPEESSPLSAPGVNISEQDHLLAINGTPVNKETTPRELLLGLAGQEVTLTVCSKGKKKSRDVVVKTMRQESKLLYRSWVEANRRKVHKESNGSLGYVHIPNMGPLGFSEFHRYYLAECNYDGLVVDVRYNGGGHVSQLLLEKLARKRIGYCATRWSKSPEPYPHNSVAGPMIAVTNQFAGSDGDIFSHCFKLMKLGQLIGMRTWGGVVGINGQYSLVDGTIVTQPEYSFWFKDVEWKVENYGAEPDMEVDISPQDYAQSKDPQLETAIKMLMVELKENPPQKPALDNRPDLSLPELPI